MQKQSLSMAKRRSIALKSFLIRHSKIQEEKSKVIAGLCKYLSMVV